MQLFCNKNGYTVGSVLMLGSGEAILDTPFSFIARRNIRKLAKSIGTKKYTKISATMPLTKQLFKLAATVYWTQYGKKFGTTKKQMQTMSIEPA